MAALPPSRGLSGGLSDWTVLNDGHYRIYYQTGSFLNVSEAKQIRANGTFPDDYTFQWVRVDADGVSNPATRGRGAK